MGYKSKKARAKVHEEERADACSICDKRFSINDYLKLHVETLDEGKNAHKCGISLSI